MQQVFSGRMLNHKWKKNVRNVAVGDIVYLAEAENDDPTYRLGQIMEACPGEDGCVRTVRVQYTVGAQDFIYYSAYMTYSYEVN